MKLTLIAITAILSGCAVKTDKLTTAKILIVHGTNRIEITQPKDTVIASAVMNPVDGTLTIKGYTSSANAAAIKSNEAQAEMLQGIILQNVSMMQQFGVLAARAYGVPTGNLPTNSPAK